MVAASERHIRAIPRASSPSPALVAMSPSARFLNIFMSSTTVVERMSAAKGPRAIPATM